MKRGMQSNAALSGCESRTISLEVDKLHDDFLDNVLDPLWLRREVSTYTAAHNYTIAMQSVIEQLLRECEAKQAEIVRLRKASGEALVLLHQLDPLHGITQQLAEVLGGLPIEDRVALNAILEFARNLPRKL